MKMIAILEKFKNKFSKPKDKERFSIGFDIGTNSVKIVKLKFFKEIIELCSFNLEPLDSDLSAAIKKLAGAHQDIRKVNISVSGPSVIIRYVDFPKMELAELKQCLNFEAQKHISFAIEEVNLDSYILKENLPDNKIFVLLAAVKKEFINQRLKLIEDAGLEANIVDIDSLALINAFRFNYSDDANLKERTIALLNIGATLSNLNILDKDVPCLSRDIHIAGDTFTQKIAETFGVDFKEAEKLKLESYKEQSEKIIAATELVFSDLANELRTSFDYYESQTVSSITKIFLSGGGSLFPGLRDKLAELLSVEVEYWDPLKQICISSDIEQKSNLVRSGEVSKEENNVPGETKISGAAKILSGQLAIAVGLALRR